MPLPLVPPATLVIGYGAMAITAWALASGIGRGRRDQRAEDALDDLDEGTTLRREAGQVNATARFRRLIRPGPGRPGIEIDFAMIARLRIRKAR